MAASTGFGDLPERFRDPATARVAVLPVPYDRTSTWQKGAGRGPEAIIEASRQVEWYDIPTGSEVCRQGIATLDPVVCDEGPEQLADLVDGRVTALLRAGVLPVVLGGDHSVAIGAIRAAARECEISVLQIDAHADTRDEYAGSSYNHACVMARVREWCPVVQVGIRALDRSEVGSLDADRVFWAHEIAAAGPGATTWMDDAVSPLGEQVWVTIDLDGFDPSVLPATGTPEPGGLDWYQVTGLLERVARRRRIVGFDVVELLPHEAHWASEFLAAKLVYRFLSMIFAYRVEV